MIINPQSERPVPLSSVAEIKVVEGPAEIRRSDQERMALIQANLEYGDLGSAVAEADALLADVALPYGLSMNITGQSEEMEASFRSLMFALGLAIFLVYLVMASQFESLLHPFVILFSIPLAAVGVALALWLTDTRLSVIVFIGLIMLAGIVVNNAIVLVDLINQLRERGLDRLDAIREAARLRLRPIMMTTLTTVLGLFPMALGLGEGSELRTPMAVTVIGGLLTSTFLTLVVVPVMYSLLDRRKDARTEDMSLAEKGAAPGGMSIIHASFRQAEDVPRTIRSQTPRHDHHDLRVHDRGGPGGFAACFRWSIFRRSMSRLSVFKFLTRGLPPRKSSAKLPGRLKKSSRHWQGSSGSNHAHHRPAPISRLFLTGVKTSR